jgi:hypothetical protein
VHLTTLVLGGQGKPIAAAAGRPAEFAALTAFVDGTRGALLTSSVLALVASVIAAAGLRRRRPSVAGSEPSDSIAERAPRRGSRPRDAVVNQAEVVS